MFADREWYSPEIQYLASRAASNEGLSSRHPQPGQSFLALYYELGLEISSEQRKQRRQGGWTHLSSNNNIMKIMGREGSP